MPVGAVCTVFSPTPSVSPPRGRFNASLHATAQQLVRQPSLEPSEKLHDSHTVLQLWLSSLSRARAFIESCVPPCSSVKEIHIYICMFEFPMKFWLIWQTMNGVMWNIFCNTVNQFLEKLSHFLLNLFLKKGVLGTLNCPTNSEKPDHTCIHC